MSINSNPKPFAVNISPNIDIQRLNSLDYKEVVDPELVKQKLAEALKESAGHPAKLAGRVAEVDKQALNPSGEKKESLKGRLAVGLEISRGFIKEYPIDFSTPRDGLGCAAAQGRRRDMEDEHLNKEITFRDKPMLITAIFDGHDGDAASKYAAENFTRTFETRLQEFAERGVDEDVAIWNALKLSFVDLHRTFPKTIGGCTANVAVRRGEDLWVANLGDARTFVANKEGVTQLSEDAKPEGKFAASIEKRGGFVKEGRVQGKIGTARFIGDHNYKPVSSPRPKIVKVQVKPGDVVVQGCDGLFDVVKTETLGTYSNKLREGGFTPARAASELIRTALLAGSIDNISATVSYI